jgi:hypothetical protein
MLLQPLHRRCGAAEGCAGLCWWVRQLSSKGTGLRGGGRRSKEAVLRIIRGVLTFSFSPLVYGGVSQKSGPR